MNRKFPFKKYTSLKHYFDDYFEDFRQSKEKLNSDNLKNIIKILSSNYNKRKKIFVCGNGGSAAIANHFECDHKKILSETKKINPRIISLCSNNPLITAISNDISYNEVFKKQLEYLADQGDMLITISSSGNSENIIKAIKYAKSKKIKTLSFTGFNGGRAKKLTDYNIHIDSLNYGVVENLHHACMNIISQFIRNNVSNSFQIRKYKF